MNKTGYVSIFLCALLWSTSGLFIKLVDWHPMTIAGSRSLLAAIFLLALKFIPGKKNISGKKELLFAMIKESPKLTLAGLCYAATMILFVIANKLTAAANAIMLQYTAPIWAALFGWFFLKERPRWEQWTALVIVSLGMFFVFSGSLVSGSLKGDIIALISGIAFAANTVVLRARKARNPADILIFSHIMCFLFSIPFFFLYPPPISVLNLACISFMGIFQIGLASALFAYGISRVTAVQAMLTAAIEPVLNPVWVLLVTGEGPKSEVIAGGAVIIAAVVFSSVVSALRENKAVKIS